MTTFYFTDHQKPQLTFKKLFMQYLWKNCHECEIQKFALE